jgi:hypothetical protein
LSFEYRPPGFRVGLGLSLLGIGLLTAGWLWGRGR